MIDRGLLARKLSNLRQALDELARYAPSTLAQYRTDTLRRRATERLIQVIIEAAVDINMHLATVVLGRPSPDYYSSFGDAAAVGAVSHILAQRLAPSAGLRNRLVHEYNEIDDEIVYRAAAGARELYQQYLESVMTFLTQRHEQDAGGEG